MAAFALRLVGLLTLTLMVIIISVWALTIGSSDIGIGGVVEALSGSGDERQFLVVTTVRLPRILAALLAGASLAVAGAIMQAVTANPLASPGLLGINAGAAFAVVASLILFEPAPTAVYVWYAFVGAASAAFIVYMLASSGVGGATPLKLALSGVILSVFLGSVTSSILIFDKTTLDNVRLWSVGSLSGRPMSSVVAVSPYIGLGIVAALVFSRQVATLSLGAEVARSIGQNITRWRLTCGVVVVMLAGSAVAMAGPIGFVGLVVPHMVRLAIGTDYRWILPFCAVAGALLVILADNLLRYVLPARDIPVGVTMAIIGAPLFVFLARYRIGNAR